MTYEEKNQLETRKRAEEMLAIKKTLLSEHPIYSLEQTQKIIHELEVHQIELELQNDELHIIQDELELSQKKYFDLYDMAPIGYCTLSEDGLIEEVNFEVLDLFGKEREDAIKKPLTHFIFSEDQDIYYLFRKKFFASLEQEECELRILKFDNTPIWVHFTAIKEANKIRLTIKDISERKEYENSLKNIAHYDQLTKLPNRVLLADRLYNGMIKAKRNKQHLAVIFLDLDGFKEINDTYGHDVGDTLLIELSREMKKELRDGDTLSRIGGDEFVVVLFDMDNAKDSLPIITRILESAAKKIEINEVLIQVSASLGITFYPQDQIVNADQLLRQADQAMYQAKLTGKNSFHIFNTEENTLIREQFEGIEQVREAFQKEELVLYYQPKVNMRTGEIIGAEALMRWNHPQRGLVPPLEFLPVIEGHALSIVIGEWVIESALAQIELWQKNKINIVVSVNIGARQLLGENFVKNLENTLLRYPTVDPSMLELEVLESSKLEDLIQATDVMIACKDLGVTFLLDDFGTGYSSLIYLKRLPIKQIKIDQGFVRDILDNPYDLSILEGIISLSENFQLSVIAEGVETAEHAITLIKLGCDLGQGYAIARPMPAKDFVYWYKEYKSNELWENQTLMTPVERQLLFVKVQHLAWIKNIKNLLDTEKQSYDKYCDSSKCYFEKWLQEGGKEYLGTNYEELNLKHEEIHTFADNLLDLHKNHYIQEALDGLVQLEYLRDEFIAQLSI